ncbi:hypothetical protein [Candidatus Amarolinea dominans]|uniref:hypothetical protein n=1 Tax=Candidatus Amarolinea dominans TaxID=3140696 RepID=UPI001D6C330A|nr:aminopeptidase [Anaerolineae bacterium]
MRQAHRIGITEQLMTQGMTADYHQIARLTEQVYDLARQAHEIHVTSPAGTDLTARFDPALRWVPCTGIYHRAGQWGNLPEGETFTCPATAEGVVAASVLGDYFSEKYGVLPTPIFFHISAGEISCGQAPTRRWWMKSPPISLRPKTDGAWANVPSAPTSASTG